MKNIKLFLAALLAIAISACNPHVEKASMGSPVPEANIDIDVSNVDGGNEITMINNTPGTIAYWNYLVGMSTTQQVKAVVPFMGDVTITCTIIGEGGQTTTTRTVNVTKLDKEVPQEWVLFAKDAEGKVWDWNTDVGGYYGYAGYGNNWSPSWGTWGMGTETPRGDIIPGDEEMLFDLNGGANFTKRKKDGTVIEKGSFSFDMSKKKIKSNGDVWSIGELRLKDASVLNPYGGGWYGGEENVIYVFDILTLTENEMVLSWATPQAVPKFEQWEPAVFWMFKAE